jgi:hypothetical protein
VVTFAEVQKSGAGGPFNLELRPAEVRREVRVEFRSNESDTDVSVDGVKAGRTPLTHTLVFQRKSGDEAWPAVEVRMSKDGYEYSKPGDTEPEPFFVRNVPADFKGGAIEATDFVVTQFVPSPVRFFEARPSRVAIVTTNLWSQVAGGEHEKPTSITSLRPDAPLVVSRLAVVPDQLDQFVYVEPVWDDRAAAKSAALESRLLGSQLMLQKGAGTTPMTDAGRHFDLDPFVTRNWIYFSSDRTGDRIIWRVPVSGKGGYTPITGTHTKFDTEPAVNGDETRLAFVSRQPDAPASTPSYVWISDVDGKLPTRYFPGRSPAWSPDGKRLAFVNPASQLCVFQVDSGETTLLMQDKDHDVAWPSWVNDHRIVYADNENKNGRKARHHDLWLWDLDNNSKQALTSDGSFDSSSVVAGGKQVFFYSNRGATRPGQEQLRIYGLLLDTAQGAPGR